MVRGRLAQVGLLLLAVAGCQAFEPSVAQQPGRARVVKPATYAQPASGPPRVQMDIVFASRPLGDRSINEAIWQPADETVLPLEEQDRLRSEGFRVGMLSGQPPESLDMILREIPEGVMNGHRLITVSGKPTAVMVATYKQCPEPLAKALGKSAEEVKTPRCVLRVLPTIQADDSVQLFITPAVQYGNLRRRFVPEFGPGGARQWTLEVTPNEEPVGDLTWSLTLKEDQYLLVGCYPDDENKLGPLFLVDRSSTPPRQMVVLIHARVLR